MICIHRAAVAALLSVAALAAIGRAADDKPAPPAPDLDTFEYVFTKGFFYESTVTLKVTKDGKATYLYKPRQSYPGADASIVRKNWDMPAKDAAAFLTGMVEDGLLDLETFDQFKHPTHHYLNVTCGLWQHRTDFKVLPEKLYRRLLPVLAQAHPEQWKVAEAKRPPLPDGTRIDSIVVGLGLGYGRTLMLSVSRTGQVSYSAADNLTLGRAPIPPVHKGWTIPEKDAAALLDGLIEDGLLKGREANDGNLGSPGKLLGVTYGRWTMHGPGHIPGKALLRLMPLMGKGVAEK